MNVRKMSFAVIFVFLWLVRSLPAFAQMELSGEWAGKYHEDQTDRIPGDVQGDFSGVPLNDAARMYAESYDVRRVVLLEHQCEPYNLPHIFRGPLQFRIWEEKDPATRRRSSRTSSIWARISSGARSGWTGGRIHRNTRRTRLWVFRPASGTATSSR